MQQHDRVVFHRQAVLSAVPVCQQWVVCAIALLGHPWRGGYLDAVRPLCANIMMVLLIYCILQTGTETVHTYTSMGRYTQDMAQPRYSDGSRAQVGEYGGQWRMGDVVRSRAHLQPCIYSHVCVYFKRTLHSRCGC